MQQYLRMMLPVVRITPGKSLPEIRMLPTVPGRSGRVPIQPHDDFPRAWLWRDGAQVFWQVTFASLLPDGSVGVCQRCGRELPPTRKDGRATKQRYCVGCRSAAWQARKPEAERRARWRRMYKEKCKRQGRPYRPRKRPSAED
jgi:hypothetical protein